MPRMTIPTPAPAPPAQPLTDSQRISSEILRPLFEEMRAELPDNATYSDLGEVIGVSIVRLSQWRGGRGIGLIRLDKIIRDWNAQADLRKLSVTLEGGTASVQWDGEGG